ncbi:GNAT family N-acetyltransferase [Enterococcus sp. UD-01]|jgi:GNAT superfamily N-acetyltransferase|uniref:GNAT family N-acetyltransferase n=1 Tax=Enterococcus sp. UD-01 TaxID=3373911 RepID=UPI0038360722
MTIQIRRFQPLDAAAVAQLLHRNFLEVNSLDYPFAQMEKLVAEYTPDKLCEQARYAHTYVAESRDQIIGTGTICPYWGSVTESIILSVFVHPDKHRKGIGSLLMDMLKQDEFFLRADRIEVPASRTAKQFYLNQGFTLKNQNEPEDEQGYIRMEIYPNRRA